MLSSSKPLKPAASPSPALTRGGYGTTATVGVHLNPAPAVRSTPGKPPPAYLEGVAERVDVCPMVEDHALHHGPERVSPVVPAPHSQKRPARRGPMRRVVEERQELYFSRLVGHRGYLMLHKGEWVFDASGRGIVFRHPLIPPPTTSSKGRSSDPRSRKRRRPDPMYPTAIYNHLSRRCPLARQQVCPRHVQPRAPAEAAPYREGCGRDHRSQRF